MQQPVLVSRSYRIASKERQGKLARVPKQSPHPKESSRNRPTYHKPAALQSIVSELGAVVGPEGAGVLRRALGHLARICKLPATSL